VAVRDLDRARADYETLGFQILPGGHFPGGASNDPADKLAADKRAIALPMFFIEYVPDPNDHRKRSDKSHQPNYVVGVRAIWVGVHTLVLLGSPMLAMAVEIPRQRPPCMLRPGTTLRRSNQYMSLVRTYIAAHRRLSRYHERFVVEP
jgi:hypothetical protein